METKEGTSWKATADGRIKERKETAYTYYSGSQESETILTGLLKRVLQRDSLTKCGQGLGHKMDGRCQRPTKGRELPHPPPEADQGGAGVVTKLKRAAVYTALCDWGWDLQERQAATPQ